MTFTLPVPFWNTALATLVVLVWLPRGVLPPFVAGMVLGIRSLDPVRAETIS